MVTNFLKKIQNLKIWQKGGKRAPHKPLLLLTALSYAQRNKERLLMFGDIEKPLTDLLIEFGPIRRNYQPEEPFKRLPNDGVWELKDNQNNVVEKGSRYTKSDLKNEAIRGGFTLEIYNLIKSDKGIIGKISSILLNAHFPKTIHQDILDAIGLNIDASYQEQTTQQKKRKRDPAFRGKILEAYNYRCAICDFDVRLGNTSIALEAAHIKWHQAGGPDTENNGLALCSLHHKLLDRGALGISNKFTVIISDKVNGYAGFQEWLMDFEGKELSPPKKDIYIPDTDFTDWHIREVFQGN
ncbi:restriction endonuclease [Candidatus Woesearchaeota archaeon]|nr:restriction endonuclease [Lentimicrobiaceae bacterium]MBT7556503.1 restriction endonuclease [Candidatus Woesearchaeota archaeon]